MIHSHKSDVIHTLFIWKSVEEGSLFVVTIFRRRMKSAEEGLHICLDEKVLMEHYMFVAMISVNVETISTNSYLLMSGLRRFQGYNNFCDTENVVCPPLHCLQSLLLYSLHWGQMRNFITLSSI